MSEAENERRWAQRARAGSAADFSRLVGAHQQSVRGFLRRLTGNHADADDLAQETFVFAWEHIARFEAGRAFRPWLFGIAWRKYRQGKRSWLRRVRREDQAAEKETLFHPDPGMRLDMTAALGRLPPEQRAALLLCLMEQMTHDEAAAALALPLGTVKSHVARGREKLTVMLGGPNG